MMFVHMMPAWFGICLLLKFVSLYCSLRIFILSNISEVSLALGHFPEVKRSETVWKYLAKITLDKCICTNFAGWGPPNLLKTKTWNHKSKDLVQMTKFSRNC